MIRKTFSLTAQIVMCGLFMTLSAAAQHTEECDYDRIPLLIFNTIDSVMPTRTIISAPEGCVGTSITDNNYVPGSLCMVLDGDTLLQTGDYVKGTSGARIKIRGNSTGAFLKQHPYKIKLSKKADLLRRSKDYKAKEWVLMPLYTWNVAFDRDYTNLIHELGRQVATAMGEPWVAQSELVNLRLNGQWQGMYYLMEAVTGDPARLNVGNGGFIIEHDAFWWKTDTYFKTEGMSTVYGYTFKAPDEDDLTPESIEPYRVYFDEVQRRLNEHRDASDLIDYDSFARWLLAHDLLGSNDAAGTNRYLYNPSFNTENPTASLTRTGPLWDFDSSFLSDGFAVIHSSWDYYYPWLLQQPAFLSRYFDLWKEIGADIEQKVVAGMEAFREKYNPIFEESMKMHTAVCVGSEALYTPLDTQVDEIEELFRKRVVLMDSLVADLEKTTIIQPVLEKMPALTTIVAMDGRQYAPESLDHLPRGVYLLRYSDGTVKKVLRGKK